MMSSRDIRGLRRHAISRYAMLFFLVLPNVAAAQVAGSAASGEAQPEFAPRGERASVRQIKYGDWQKFCFKTPGSKRVCRTTISGTFDTGQSALRADLIEREGENTARLQIFVPVGMYLQAGVKLRVDQGKAHQIPYVWCVTNTCIAANVADASLIREMEKGQILQLEVVDSSLQKLDTTLPIGQFGTAHRGAPERSFEQEIDE